MNHEFYGNDKAILGLINILLSEEKREPFLLLHPERYVYITLKGECKKISKEDIKAAVQRYQKRKGDKKTFNLHEEEPLWINNFCFQEMRERNE